MIMSVAFLFSIVFILTVAYFTQQLKIYKSRLKAQQDKLIIVEEELLEKEHYVRTILNTEPECVKLLDSEGMVLDINPAGISLVEAEHSNQVLGNCIYPLIDFEYLNEYKMLVKNVFTGFSQSLVFKMKSLKGNIRWMETHCVPMRTKSGGIVAALGITRDITERINAEEAARCHHEELVRVCRLLSVGELASTLAHELNQPLCAILNYAITLEKEIKSTCPGELIIQDYANRVTRETERAGMIVQRLRQFVSKYEPVKSIVNINELVNDVSELMFAELKRHHIKYTLEVSKTPCLINGDHIQIQQVLINLITNSIDAMKNVDEEKRILIVKIDCKTNECRNISIDVIDNGQQTENINYNRLFESFYTTKSGGIGIGLSISLSIIESHGGSIKYTITKNAGMRFTITLPKHQEEEQQYAEIPRKITTCVFSG